MNRQGWDDLFLRTDREKTPPDGEEVVIGSPDIIATGAQPEDPAPYATKDDYDDKDHHQQPFRQGEPNYVYVRAKNDSPDATVSGVVRLVMGKPGDAVWPGGDGWTRLRTAAGDDWSELDDVPPGGIGITGLRGRGSQPFVVVPDAPGEHNLVAWISTPQHPERGLPPRIETVEELEAWLEAHPNYAQQAITVAADRGTHTRSVPFVSGNRRARWTFALSVRGGRGYTVSMSCGRRLQDGQYIRIEPETLDSDDGTLLGIERTVEAGFSADIVYTYDQNGHPLRPDFHIALTAHATAADDGRAERPPASDRRSGTGAPAAPTPG